MCYIHVYFNKFKYALNHSYKSFLSSLQISAISSISSSGTISLKSYARGFATKSISVLFISSCSFGVAVMRIMCSSSSSYPHKFPFQYLLPIPIILFYHNLESMKTITYLCSAQINFLKYKIQKTHTFPTTLFLLSFY